MIAYISNKGYLYFSKQYSKDNEIVYRSFKKYNIPLRSRLEVGKPIISVRYEGEIFGLNDTLQEGLIAYNEAEKLNHPEDCIMDIDATFNLLKYRFFDNSLLQNLRERK